MFRGVRPALLASAAVSGPFPGPRAKMHRDGEKLQASDSIIPPGRRAARRGRTWRRVPAPHPYKYAVPGATASLPGRPDGRRRMETLDNEGFCAYIACRETPPRQEAREKRVPGGLPRMGALPKDDPRICKNSSARAGTFSGMLFFQHVRQHPATDLLRLHAAGL